MPAPSLARAECADQRLELSQRSKELLASADVGQPFDLAGKCDGPVAVVIEPD